MAQQEIKVPDIGDFDEVSVIEVLVKVGDRVKVEQSLITVESDKASMEVPSSAAGVVKALSVRVGDKVREGSVILTLEAEADSASPPSARPVPAPAAEGPAASAPSAPSPAPAASAPLDLVVPDIGDFDEVAVIEVLVKTGDAVQAEQSLITVESDKASMEIPSSAAGTIGELKVKVGDKVSKGSVIATLTRAVSSAPASPPSAEPAPQPAPQPSPAPAGEETVAASASPAAKAASGGPKPVPTAALPAPEPQAPTGVLPHASPSIRKFARELGVPLAEVKGSGPKGRITQDDVQGFVKAVMQGEASTAAARAAAPAVGAAGSATGAAGGMAVAPWPQVDFAKFGPVERVEMSRIKKISGPVLHRNWVMIPHVTDHDDADITDLEAFRVATNKEREKEGVKITMLAFLVKACVAALKKFPDFNASLNGDHIVRKGYFHIGFAADTPNGLVVPVIRDADKKGVIEISNETAALAKKARDGKLTPAEMSGGCFSISSLGGIGGRYFTPIINAPEVAILGFCRSQIEARWDGKAFQPRLMLPLSLSWDHRVVDGAAAARFNAWLIQILGDFRRVLL